MTQWELNIIPTTKEAYLNMRARVPIPGSKESKMKKEKKIILNFIDSLQFLSSSLASLVAICPSLPLTTSLPGSQEIKSGKGVFPYSFFDGPEKLGATELPPQSAFFNELTQTALSAEDYELAQKSWREFGCTTMGEYMKGEFVFLFSFYFVVKRVFSLFQLTFDSMSTNWRTYLSPSDSWPCSRMDSIPSIMLGYPGLSGIVPSK